MNIEGGGAAVAGAASTSSEDPHPRFAPTGTVEVPVFYPTIEEMRDFPALINKIEQKHRAHLVCGIAKVSDVSFFSFFCLTYPPHVSFFLISDHAILLVTACVVSGRCIHRELKKAALFYLAYYELKPLSHCFSRNSWRKESLVA